jgi:hypothetical protein
MKLPTYSPIEALNRVKLMMGYDPTKTLTENKESVKGLIKEDDIDTATEKSVQKILNSCSGRPVAEGTLDAAAIASAFNRSFNYMWGTDDSLWRAQATIMKKGNMDDLCNVKNEYEELGYGNFAEDLVGDLDDEELAELMETFSAMSYRSKKEAKLAVASTEQKNINWFKTQFPCVFDSDGNVDQTVRKNANNYVYILIKGTSGAQYQVFSDGRVKKTNGTSTGKKIACQGSKVTFINESVEKKSISEQIDDTELVGGNRGGGGGGTQPPLRQTPPAYRNCTGTYKKGCKSNMIAKVQGCLGLMADGKYGKDTHTKLSGMGFTSFTDSDVDKICNVPAPEVSGEIIKIDPSNTDF